MISIVIPVYQQADMTHDCINAIRETTQDFEIVIVDNGSVPAFKPPFNGFVETTLIRNEKNEGFPVAVNRGIRAAKGDTIILLNNDCFVTPGWAERLKGWLDEYSIVGPVTNYCAGMQRVQIGTYQSIEGLNEESKEWAEENAREVEEVNFIIGFCMAFKRSLFDEIGEFDESMWPCSGEEIDFCFRAREAGHKIGIANDVYVHHEGSKTFNEMEQSGQVNYLEICKRNDAHLAEKWGEDFWNKQKVIPVSVSGIRLNLGSGPFPLEGFINVDQFEHVNPDLQCDVLDLPYKPGTISEIYAGHILEHFTFKDGQRALRYWNSLLKAGGVISISVPDYDFLVKKYAANPSPEALIEMNDTYIYSGIQPSPHQYAYSAALLEKCMADAGFANLERMPVNHSYFPYPVPWQVGFTGVRP